MNSIQFNSFFWIRFTNKDQRFLILEVPEGKKFVAIVAVRGELGEILRLLSIVSRNVRKEDAKFANGKFVEIYTNLEIDT